MKNANLTNSISADSLAQIDDSFTLKDVQVLTGLNFPALASVDTVDWTGLPNLQGLSFTTGLSKVTNLGIQNTGLSSLSGISLNQVGLFLVANNIFLTDITMPLKYVSNALSLSSNGRDVHASFPDMVWANNMTFRNCSSVNVPSLGSLNGSLGFISNYFPSISAPNLTTVGGSLAFVSNGPLTNISFPELIQVNGGLQVANNTHLSAIDGFQRLARVGGAIDFNGVFKQYVTISSLRISIHNANIYIPGSLCPSSLTSVVPSTFSPPKTSNQSAATSPRSPAATT